MIFTIQQGNKTHLSLGMNNFEHSHFKKFKNRISQKYIILEQCILLLLSPVGHIYIKRKLDKKHLIYHKKYKNTKIIKGMNNFKDNCIYDI